MAWRCSLGYLGAALLAHLVQTAAAQEREPPEVHDDIVHADVPLFGTTFEQRWPQGFSDADGFGCESRVKFGDWELRQSEPTGEPSWYRLSNYGVFHCFAIRHVAEERRDLDSAEFTHGLFFLIGEVTIAGVRRELWVFQTVGRPGSSYQLLSRAASEGLVSQFDLLQAECPRRHVRTGPPLDIMSTRYCAINSRRDLLALMRRMVRRPPLGTLSWVGPSEVPAVNAS